MVARPRSAHSGCSVSGRSRFLELSDGGQGDQPPMGREVVDFPGTESTAHGCPVLPAPGLGVRGAPQLFSITSGGRGGYFPDEAMKLRGACPLLKVTQPDFQLVPSGWFPPRFAEVCRNPSRAQRRFVGRWKHPGPSVAPQ